MMNNSRANQDYMKQLEIENKRILIENANLKYDQAQLTATINIDGYNYKVDPAVYDLVEHLQMRLKQCGKQ